MNAPDRPLRPRFLRLAGALAGPALVVAAVLVVLRNFAFRDLLTVADVRTVYLPWYCFLGKSLAAGHIPTWNRYSMAGVPFAAAPESGWAYVSPMLLFTALRCSTAIRWMIVIQPILAGLGIYWFLRSEGLARAASTVGGLTLAMIVAGSNLAVTIPFSGTLAWTALTLAAASRYMRTHTWAGRVAWAVPTALAWGQLAAAHPSLGLVMGSLALVTFLIARGWTRVASGEGGIGETVAAVALLLAVLFPVNLAYFLPRLRLVPRTSLGLGYAGLQRLGTTLAGRAPGAARIGVATGPTWPLKLATSPGAHAAALALALCFAALWIRRYRPLAIAFGLYDLLCYLLGLRVVAHAVPDSIRSMRFVDFYLHSPYWFIFELFLALAVLAGLGVQAWQEAGSVRRRVAMVAPGILVWGVLPLALGAPAISLAALAGGAVVGGAVLAAAVRRPLLYRALPVVVAVELLVSGSFARGAPPFRPQPPKLAALSTPHLDLSRYVEPGAIARTLQEQDGGRYLTSGQGAVYDRASNDMLLFHNESTDGYGSIQLLRYWSFVRASQRTSLEYHRSFFVHPADPVLDLLQVEWVVASANVAPGAGWTPVDQQQGWVLYRRPSPPPRASLITVWTIVPDPDRAREIVTGPLFDPSSRVVLERDPGLQPVSGSGGTGTARFAWRTHNAGEVQVDSPSQAIVLIRNSYDPNWRATVDGRPAPVLAADYVLQGVPVGPGHHTIVLSYGDRSIGLGLLGSALSLLALLAAALALRIHSRSPGDRRSASPLAQQGTAVVDPDQKPPRPKGRVDVRRLVRFGVVSVIATVVDFGIFNLLVIPKLLSPVVATTISYSAGTVASYLLNKWFTFRGGRDSVVHEFGLFVLINVVGLALNNGAVALVAHAMGDNTLLLNMAKLAAGAATWALKFLTFKRWVFPEQPAAATSTDGGTA